ncbi:gamma-glutamyl-gamma-aminobutyrate hydrolase family protein [Subtercola endophyticus]|uniref:gamma-glutamyl-gamma-aminobutyrate hydrolase family protein n=1 Tax=Subtercola endophyticus TaxID=2895559 RepID=UPI001E4127E8|nr:gamma-glutamyl-gamma-aminobutyrate hydrolase family protein [Subtercola endophyticus]UFS57626.1 gamma-glutamyl-gamma-aminobutyrate hydrolase family protein [Subtercola endophyticus]
MTADRVDDRLKSAPRPVILISTWRRALPTYLGEATDLYTLGGEYADLVSEAGGIPLMMPHLDAAQIGQLVGRVDGVLLSGGEDVVPETPENAARNHSESALLAEAQFGAIPVFGICRGMQISNVFLGGTLVEDMPASDVHPHAEPGHNPADDRHRITASATWVREGIAQSGVVNSIHHQAVDVLGGNLATAAVADDGQVEAIESTTPGWFVRGVQWHPEKIPGREGREDAVRLLTDFIAAARERASARTVSSATTERSS